MAILSLVSKCLCAKEISSTDHSETVDSQKKEPTSHHNIERILVPLPVDSDLKPPTPEYRIFKYAELKKATNDFEDARILGEGSFGIVYHGMLEDGLPVAIKCQKGTWWTHEKKHGSKTQRKLLNEVDILRRLSHENLVHFYGCTSPSDDGLYIVQEYVPNGTLSSHLHGKRGRKDGTIIWPARFKIAIQIASALAYLHASSILHRDIKSSNILLDNNFNVKVSDFGLSRFFPSEVTHVTTVAAGSPGYIDPEYYKSGRLSRESDVYSFGVVLVELISSLPAWLYFYPHIFCQKRITEEPCLARYAEALIQGGKIEELVDPALGFESEDWVKSIVKVVGQLAFRCLHRSRNLRPSMAEVLDHLLRIRDEDVDAVNVCNFKLDPVTSYNNFRETHIVDRLPDDYFDKLRV